MTGPKFFFEEDPESEKSSLTWEEQAESLENTVSETGIMASIGSMEPKGVEIETVQMGRIDGQLLTVEHGVVKNDYVIHITPHHPKKNLKHQSLLKAAILTCVSCLNKVVPPSVTVEIFPPRDDWEIKMLSFKIIDGATAWNVDTSRITSETIPEIISKVTEICYKS